MFNQIMFTIMKKTYYNAELQIVRVNNNDIVTASTTVNMGNPITGPGAIANSPERRKSIWD